MTQEELAKQIGVERSSIGKYESTETIPSPDILLKLANLFNCSVDYLLGRNDKEKPTEMEKSLPDIMYRYNELSDDQQREVIAFMEFKLAQQTKKPDIIIGQIAAFGSGPTDVPVNKEASQKLAALAKKKRTEKKEK